ncbi:MAG TPA: MFS transporter [Terracidiphilus sp.]|nr:MFS transporter [Terracidiphilus sp.]
MTEPSTTQFLSANRNSTGLSFTINGCMFIFGIVLFLVGSLLPTLHVSNAHAGSLGSIPLIGILAATVVAGPILDIHGARQMLIVALILIAGSLALMPSLSVFWQLEICCLAYGFGGGVLNTATNVLIADLHVESRARALNLLGFFFSAGSVAAPLLMSLAGGALSQAVVLRLLAAFTAAVLFPVLFFRFPPPLQAGVRIRNLLTVIHQPLVWLLGLILFFESGSENCMFVWAGKIATEAFHAPAARGSLALVALGTALGAGRLGAVVWLRWLGNLGTVWLSVCLVVTGVLIALAARSLPIMILAMAVIGLGISAIFPTVLGIAGEHFPGETGTAFGAIIALALIGGAAGPKTGGYAISYGPLQVLWIPAVSAAGVGILTAVAVRTRQRA